MKKQFLVACYDKVMQMLVVKNLRMLEPYAEIMELENESDLIIQLYSTKDVTVYFDKYFLGYVLKYKIKEFQVLNPGINIVFVEKGNCPLFFGVRLYFLGVNSFICNLEDSSLVRDSFVRTMHGMNCYPDEVINFIEEKGCMLDKKNWSEITVKELEIALHLGLGETSKEICYALDDMAEGTIGSHINKLRKKIGYKTLSDFTMLNNRTFLRELKHS